jgi:DNA polymerase-3 subunit gamma/tau
MVSGSSGLFEDDAALPAPPVDSGPGLFGDAPPDANAAPVASPAADPPTPYRVLARAYRPTNFDDLIGQEAMVRTLRRAFALGRVAHAFMLTGVRGVGKTTTARIIARCLTCVGPDGAGGPTAEPCGVCPNCRAILADRHPDVVEMDAASKTGVDDVREIIEATRFRPMQARMKVFVIDEVHMLSRNAFNALLKTLEEPPPHVTFVFATTEIRKVPVTVLSRCQRFDLRRVRVAELSALFARIAEKEAVAIGPGALDLIARAADGSVRDGLSLLDQAIAQGALDGGMEIGADMVADMLGLADRIAVFDLLEAMMAGEPARALAATDRAHERGADLGLLLADLLALVHTLTRLKSIPELRDGAELPEAERTRGAALADRLPMPALARAWQMLLKGIAEVEQAPDRRAAAEMVLIRLCHVADMPSPADLIRTLTTGGASPSVAPPRGGGAGAGGGGAGGGGTTLAHAPSPASPPAEAEAPAPPRITSLRDIAVLLDVRREAMLHAHLLHAAHLVRLAPPVIELRMEQSAPRDFAQRLGAVLNDATGTRWTVVVASSGGAPTMAEQAASLTAAKRADAADHPLVRAILEAFPGATIGDLHDATMDAYGLPPETEPALNADTPDDPFDDMSDPMETDA